MDLKSPSWKETLGFKDVGLDDDGMILCKSLSCWIGAREAASYTAKQNPLWSIKVANCREIKRRHDIRVNILANNSHKLEGEKCTASQMMYCMFTHFLKRKESRPVPPYCKHWQHHTL